jgi:hypothetical protein
MLEVEFNVEFARDGLEDAQALRHDLLADAVAGHDRDSMLPHLSPPL